MNSHPFVHSKHKSRSTGTLKFSNCRRSLTNECRWQRGQWWRKILKIPNLEHQTRYQTGDRAYKRVKNNSERQNDYIPYSYSKLEHLYSNFANNTKIFRDAIVSEATNQRAKNQFHLRWKLLGARAGLQQVALQVEKVSRCRHSVGFEVVSTNFSLRCVAWFVYAIRRKISTSN